MKIYLDTSIISHLDHDDAPEKMTETKALWNYSRRDYLKYIYLQLPLKK